MQMLGRTAVILALMGLASAGYHLGGSSYSVVTKHELPHHGWSYLGGHGGLGSGGLVYGKGLGGEYGEGYSHEPYHYPKYSFDYGVKDEHTGDHKNQWEHRNGDLVKGGYSLKEADGTTRVVHYTADDHNGFNAVVKKIGHAYHPQVYHKAITPYGGSHGTFLGSYGDGWDHGYASSFANVHQHH